MGKAGCCVVIMLLWMLLKWRSLLCIWVSVVCCYRGLWFREFAFVSSHVGFCFVESQFYAIPVNVSPLVLQRMIGLLDDDLWQVLVLNSILSAGNSYSGQNRRKFSHITHDTYFFHARCNKFQCAALQLRDFACEPEETNLRYDVVLACPMLLPVSI